MARWRVLFPPLVNIGNIPGNSCRTIPFVVWPSDRHGPTTTRR